MAVLSGLTDAAVIVDRELRPLMWNEPYVKLTTLSETSFNDAVRERRCHNLFTLDVCATNCLARRAFDSGRFVRTPDVRGFVLGEPENRTLIVSTIPVSDEDGAIVGALETYRDVTAEARIRERYSALLEKERRRAESLEQAVATRTTELQESLHELTETRAQLVRREKLSALGNFVAGIAHELNNPINFVYGNIELVESRTLSLRQFWQHVVREVMTDEQRARLTELAAAHGLDEDTRDLDESMAGIANGAERAARIIRDLRGVILGGSAERTVVRVADAAEAALQIALRDMGEAIDVHVDLDQECVANANQSQLVQVILNLLQNARDAIGNEGGLITLGVTRTDDGVCIVVEDDGPGISDDEQLRIFDPFYTTKGAGGMGLGLSLSQSIVDGHGGRLGVVSKPGEGARFTVWLPNA